MKSFYEVNDLISQKLNEGNPFSCLRIDNTMGYIMDTFHKNELPVQQFFNQGTFLEGGIYPIDPHYYRDQLIPVVTECMHDSDILGFVDISGEILRCGYLDQFDSNKPKFAGKSWDFLVMDPGALLGYSSFGEVKNPWPMSLKGKKVLVISTHKETILKQWENIDKIWGDRKDLIAPFELVDVIRSPYHPMMDDRQYDGFDTFLDSVEYIKGLIDTYDYDVLLAGCTASAPMYCKHAKSKGKMAIQTGGTIQLFFGILGTRWTKQDVYKSWAPMYNEHWIYPLEVDEASKRKDMTFLETNYAYWNL